MRWLAPELCLLNQAFSTKSDVWAFGVTLWEIMTFARLPYGQLRDHEVKAEVKNGLQLARPEVCNDAMHAAMTSCWRTKARARPTFASLRGTLKLLTMPQCSGLLDTVWSVTHWKDKEAAGTAAPGAAVGGRSVQHEIDMGAFKLIEYREEGQRGLRLGMSTPVPVPVPVPVDAGTGAGCVAGGAGRAVAAAATDAWQQETFHVLDSMKHANVMSLLGYRATATTLEVLVRAAGSTSLHRRLGQDASEWSAAQRDRVVLGVAEALEYVHVRGFVHGVVCPLAVYVDAGLTARLVFHTAWRQEHELDPAFASGVCFRRFLAPEAATSGHISSAADVYSFGVLLWQVHHPGMVPHAEFGTAEALAARVAAARGVPPPLTPPLPDGTATGVADVFAACCQARLTERPDMSGVAAVLRDAVKGAGRYNVRLMAARPADTRRAPRRTMPRRVAAPSCREVHMPSLFAAALDTEADPTCMYTHACATMRAPSPKQVPRDCLFHIETLGAGQFGQVNKMATNFFSAAGDFSFVAVKTLLEGDEGGDEDDGSEAGAVDGTSQLQREADFAMEIETMKQLSHPHLVTMLGCCVEAHPFLMILEFSCGGSLEDWLPDNGQYPPPTHTHTHTHVYTHTHTCTHTHACTHTSFPSFTFLVNMGLTFTAAPNCFIRGIQCCGWRTAHSSNV